MYNFVDDETTKTERNFNANYSIDKNFTELKRMCSVLKYKRQVKFPLYETIGVHIHYIFSTKSRNSSRFEPFDEARLLAFRSNNFHTQRRPLFAHLSTPRTCCWCVRVYRFQTNARVNAQQFLPPSFFSSHSSSISDDAVTKKSHNLLIVGIFS